MIALSLLLPSVLLLLSLPLITIIVLHHYHCYWHRIHYECHHHHQHHHHHHDHHHHHHHHHHQPCLQQAPGSMNEIQTSTNRYPKDPNTYAEIPAIDQRTNQNAKNRTFMPIYAEQQDTSCPNSKTFCRQDHGRKRATDIRNNASGISTNEMDDNSHQPKCAGSPKRITGTSLRNPVFLATVT